MKISVLTKTFILILSSVLLLTFPTAASFAVPADEFVLPGDVPCPDGYRKGIIVDLNWTTDRSDDTISTSCTLPSAEDLALEAANEQNWRNVLAAQESARQQSAAWNADHPGQLQCFAWSVTHPDGVGVAAGTECAPIVSTVPNPDPNLPSRNAPPADEFELDGDVPCPDGYRKGIIVDLNWTTDRSDDTIRTSCTLPSEENLAWETLEQQFMQDVIQAEQSAFDESAAWNALNSGQQRCVFWSVSHPDGIQVRHGEACAPPIAPAPTSPVSLPDRDAAPAAELTMQGDVSCPDNYRKTLSVNLNATADMSDDLVTTTCILPSEENLAWEAIEQEFIQSVENAKQHAWNQSEAWNMANPGKQKCFFWIVTHPDGVSVSYGNQCAQVVPSTPGAIVSDGLLESPEPTRSDPVVSELQIDVPLVGMTQLLTTLSQDFSNLQDVSNSINQLRSITAANKKKIQLPNDQSSSFRYRSLTKSVCKVNAGFLLRKKPGVCKLAIELSPIAGFLISSNKTIKMK